MNKFTVYFFSVPFFSKIQKKSLDRQLFIEKSPSIFNLFIDFSIRLHPFPFKVPEQRRRRHSSACVSSIRPQNPRYTGWTKSPIVQNPFKKRVQICNAIFSSSPNSLTDSVLQPVFFNNSLGIKSSRIIFAELPSSESSHICLLQKHIFYIPDRHLRPTFFHFLVPFMSPLFRFFRHLALSNPIFTPSVSRRFDSYLSIIYAAKCILIDSSPEAAKKEDPSDGGFQRAQYHDKRGCHQRNNSSITASLLYIICIINRS